MCSWASQYWLLAIWFGILLGSGQSGTGPFRPPQPYELEQVYKQIKQRCPSNALGCFRTELQSITAQHGPRAAIEAFTLLKDRGDIEPRVDGHHIAHHIGHETAMIFGPTAKAFALCPASYNYGCMHGFFQHALGTGEIADKDAAKICDDLAQDPILSLKTKLSCYHGFGHGVMIHVDYELPQALNACDNLNGPFAQQGCWQGVFMENMDAAQEGRWQKGRFSLEDPLAPCDRLDEKYQYECFINQSGWLMQFYQNDVAKAAQACLKAPRPSITPCLETIGLLTTNSEWQSQLLQKADSKTFLENAWTVCTRFPRGYVDYCMVAALDNLMNSNTVDIDQAHEFCHIVSKGYRAECRSRLDGNLRYLMPQKRKRPRRRTATEENRDRKPSRLSESPQAPAPESFRRTLFEDHLPGTHQYTCHRQASPRLLAEASSRGSDESEGDLSEKGRSPAGAVLGPTCRWWRKSAVAATWTLTAPIGW